MSHYKPSNEEIAKDFTTAFISSGKINAAITTESTGKYIAQLYLSILKYLQEDAKKKD